MSPTQTLKKSSEFAINLEPSSDVHITSVKIKPTESLIINNNDNKNTEAKINMKNFNTDNISTLKSIVENSTYSVEMKETDLKIRESASKMMEIIGTVVHEFIQNSTNEREIEIKPKEVILN